MANPVITGDIVKVQAVSVQGVQTALNDVFFRVDNHIGGGATDTEIAAYLETNLAPLYKAILTDNASWYGLLVQKVWPLPLFAHVVNRAHTGVGTAGTSSLPGEVSSVVAAKTPLAGRAFQGRIFLPFLDANDTAGNGTLTTTSYQTRAGLVASALYIPQTIVGGAGTTHMLPVIFHRAPNKSGTTTANSTTDISSFTVESLLATQRRRGARGRANTPPV